MANVNQVILVGHLGHDPEVRQTPKGTAISSFRMATTKRWKDRESGERRERTEWHRVVVFGRQAEVFADRAAKGALVHVEGALQTREWNDREGAKRYTTEILARRVQILGLSKREEPVTTPPPAAEEPPVDQEPEAPAPEDDIPF